MLVVDMHVRLANDIQTLSVRTLNGYIFNPEAGLLHASTVAKPGQTVAMFRCIYLYDWAAVSRIHIMLG